MEAEAEGPKLKLPPITINPNPQIDHRTESLRFRLKLKMGRKRGSSGLNVAFNWVRRRSVKVKVALGFAVCMCALIGLKYAVEDRNQFFVASEGVHAAGILVLVYKLTTQKTCSGLSLRTQELTAMFLGVRVCLSYLMEGDIHTVLDFAALGSTLWVIYMIRFDLKSTYIKELDNMPRYKVIVPCALLALIVHPHSSYPLVIRVLWAFCVYLESISVLPQLRMMQNAKMVEPFTARYVFALGVARFLGCAHWIFLVYESGGEYLLAAGKGYLWLPMVLLSELVQTGILADFCYYYVKSVMDGQLVMSLNAIV